MCFLYSTGVGSFGVCMDNLHKKVRHEHNRTVSLPACILRSEADLHTEVLVCVSSINRGITSLSRLT